MTDAPACALAQINVAVAGIRVHRNGIASSETEGWNDLTLSPPLRVDLASLTNGALQELGTLPLPAGRYGQLRLILESNPDPNSAAALHNSVVLSDGTEIPIDTGSASQSGIQRIYSFDVPPGGLIDLVLDFDACRSLVKQNSVYILKPVIQVIEGNVSGAISGWISPTVENGPALLNPVVSAQKEGKSVKSTVPTSEGHFILSPLPEGRYDLVLTGTNAAAAMIQSVPVTPRETTVINAPNRRILPSHSEIGSVGGTAIPIGSMIRAIQTFTTGGAMEVHFAISDGQYQMALPIGPPSKGLYGAGAAMTLEPDVAMRGRYRMEASSEGFPDSDPKEVDFGGGSSVNPVNFDLTRPN